MIKQLLQRLGFIKTPGFVQPFDNGYGHQVIGAHLCQAREWSSITTNAIAAHIANASNKGLRK